MDTNTTKRCSCCGEVKPVAEFSRNGSRSDGLHNQCKTCKRVVDATWRAANREKHRASSLAWVAANRKKHLANVAAWAAANPEKVRAKNAAWRAANAEHVRATRTAYYAANREKVCAANAAWRAANPEKERAAAAAWAAANREKMNAWEARRRAEKLRATPKWSDKAACDAVYMHAATASRLLGEEMHVDHVVPLKCKIASGLHVPANLAIVDAKRNISKNAKLDMAQLAAHAGLVLDEHGWLRSP
jgi:hypothetical protein